MITSEDLTYIGAFGKHHGYKGDLNLRFDQFDNDQFLEKKCPIFLLIDGCFIPFFITEWRRKGKSDDYLVRLDGYDSDSKVAMFERQEIFGERSVIEELYPDFMFENQMVFEGARVVDFTTGKELGTLVAMDRTTDNWLMEVEQEDGEMLTLPFHEDFLRGVEEEEDGTLTYQFDFPEGLLDLYTSDTSDTSDDRDD